MGVAAANGVARLFMEFSAMADWNDRSVRVGTGTQAIDAGLRAYMLGVYNYMALGVALTGLAAYAIAHFAATSDPTGVQIGRDLFLTDFGRALYLSPLRWVVMLAPLGFVFFISAGVQRMSASETRRLGQACEVIRPLCELLRVRYQLDALGLR